MREIYFDAKDFLIREVGRPDAAEIVESYLTPPCLQDELTINDVFKRILISAQNAHMKASVIGREIGGIENLGKALFGFDPRKVEQAFAGAPKDLLPHIVRTLKLRKEIAKRPGVIWSNYCKTILSATEFLKQFKDGKDFRAWANHLYSDPRSMPALPMVIAAEVDGLGYALACDFLKELGFVNYGKPDVHVKEIFTGLGLCRENPSPYQIQKKISLMAEAASVSAYAVDKVLWLIGSGFFYNHTDLGRSGRIGKRKGQFLAHSAKAAQKARKGRAVKAS